ncbi:MAG TPA: MerR family transcriptional regulator [Deltaproteobacteria bacterium]|jgi:DNA-binding transcriptional MerR regulator|nr:MerR family transcriptional regulator [Deltaproteobacteria bacterium]OQC29558.1 MAG: Mercuric resistance operon regulatory protein [Deltaproteobacteria bacterium ADurb.Bin072]HRW80052.1 MerR family transcriptional regulator [Desulfomonilia bacterium]NMD40040.1 MerR family transcriptional regulator [Deltaproteobacteria bacterium]HNQ84502.1 MerR family transcriptional regulator [Deltaproteobacteria bacterium]
MGLKIGEIAKKSGVAPSTIRYYVRQGLLPEPDKVNKSMAYYDERCIEKIHAVRHLQERKYFPLSVIKNILRRMDQGMSLDEAESIEDAVFGAQEGMPEKVMDKAGFMEATGLTREELQTASRIGLLIPYHQEKGRTLYNQEDVLFAREVLKKIISFGQDLHELSFYVDLGRQIVECEMNLRRSAVKNRSAQENIRITAEISKMADMLRGYILRRLFQRKVQAAIQKSLSDS